MAFQAACLFDVVSCDETNDPNLLDPHHEVDMPAPKSETPVPPSVQDLNAGPEQLPDLTELYRLLRLQKYQRRKQFQTENTFRRSHITVSKNHRLNVSARHVCRTLTDCLRSEDKHSFANLFNAFHDACCQREPDVPVATETDELLQDVCTSSTNGFWNGISSGSRKAIIGFLSSIRFDAQYVTDRLDALNQKELLALLPDGGHARSGESVFGSYPRSSSRSTKPMGYVVDRLIDDLTAHAYRSPLETILHLHNPSGSMGSDYARSTDFWASVCARMISGQKPGSHKLVPALLDFWSEQKTWPGKERIRLWILRTLQDGRFILDQPNRQTFRVRSQGQPDLPSEEQVRTEGFYVNAVNSLLDLFGSTDGASLIPNGAKDFARSMCQHLDAFPDHQKSLAKYLARWWLFASFVPDLLTLPESHGLLYEYYVSDPACHKILREVAVRSQKVVLDVVYAWRHGNVVPTDTVARVHRVLAHLDFTDAPSAPSKSAAATAGGNENAFLAVSASDVVTLINALHPFRRPASLSSDRDTLRSGVQSSGSSISGFSLFPSMDQPYTQGFTPVPANHAMLSPRPLSSAFSSYSMPSQENLVADSSLVDARLELEDWMAASCNADETHWALLEVLESDCRFEAYGDALTDTFNDVSQGDEEPRNGDRAGFLAGKAAIASLLELQSSTDISINDLCSGHPQNASEIIGQILELFESQIASREAKLDFVAAHTWLSSMENFEDFVTTAGSGAVVQLLVHMQSSSNQAAESSQAMVQQCEDWIKDVNTTLTSTADTKARWQVSLTRLKAKMWYVSDVRTSSAYDQIRAIASALRVMGKSKRTATSKQMPPLRHWNGSKISSHNTHLKSDAQILDLLGTLPEHGGPNKLSGDQARVTLSWLERNDVFNICSGEERLHKFCMEVRKCVEQMVPNSSSDAALLWSNVLFSQDSTDRGVSTPKGSAGLSDLDPSIRRFDSLRLQTNVPPSMDSISSASHTLSSVSSRDYFDSARSPTLTTKSSGNFWSPAMTEVRPPSSATSVSSFATRAPTSPRKPANAKMAHSAELADDLREALTGLLISDVGGSLFGDGSETDIAFWTGLSGELTEQHLQTQHEIRVRPAVLERPNGLSTRRRARGFGFDFERAFQSMFELFASDCDPFRKLQNLNDVQILLQPYMAQHGLVPSTQLPNATQDSRTKPNRSTALPSILHVEGFRLIFSNRAIRPPSLFRDLQYIASLVPAPVLVSPKGKAFYNAVTAASRLKVSARELFVETADSIIAHHTSSRGPNRSASHAQQQRDSAAFAPPTRTPSAEAIARYSMADAATLLQISAKEGDAAAQRELATLYLTHPELMEHVIAPFARPREVFREELEAKWGKGRIGGDRARGSEKCDPRTMCVAHHWMGLAARGGDALAKEVLRQQDEMEKLP